MSIASYITALDRDRDNLAANLNTMGVAAYSSETFTSLVPKVLNIPSGGEEWMQEAFSPNVINLPSGYSWNTLMHIGNELKTLTIENLTFTSSSAYNAFLGFRNLKEVTFKNCQFGSSANNYGLKINNSAGADYARLEKVTIENCSFVDTASASYFSLTIDSSSPLVSTDVIIKNCTVTGRGFKELCYGGRIQTVTFNNVDVTNATNFSKTFQNCSALTTLDLSGWNAPNVTNVSYMFSGCTSLQTLDISGWDIPSLGSSYRTDFLKNVPTTCTIYVKNATVQSLLTSWDSTHTYTIKT